MRVEHERNVVAAVVSTAEGGSPRQRYGGSASPKTMPNVIAEGPDIRRQSRSLSQRVEDNAFHLDYFSAMMRLSYLSPKTEVRESKIHGRGLFATTEISKHEIVAVKGGHIVDRNTLREQIAPRLGPVEIQIDEDLFIAPVTDEERELSMLYSNHSCNPNLGVRGEITFVAMRDIRAGEELTHDWAMTDDDDYSVECKCGAPNCRKILTGKDWQRADLQTRYAGYFSAYLARKIAVLDNQC
jgi:hypothetical protein